MMLEKNKNKGGSPRVQNTLQVDGIVANGGSYSVRKEEREANSMMALLPAVSIVIWKEVLKLMLNWEIPTAADVQGIGMQSTRIAR